MTAQALWLALSRASIGSATFVPLIDRFGSLENAAAAPDDDLLASGLIGRSALPRFREGCAAAEGLLAELRHQHLQLLTWDDPHFPSQLHAISSGPPALFIRGIQSTLSRPLIAIVGTRQPPEWAAACARTLAAGLAQRGFGVISGLAYGIDAAAHRGALEASAGMTVAVLGSSHDRLYPTRHGSLATEIARRGAVISAYPPGTEATAPQLVARNRIITALSGALIVVAARPESGSRHAVRFAQEQSRLVLAIPGTPGCDALLAAGAADPLEWPPEYDRLAQQLQYASDLISRPTETKKRAGLA